MNHKIISIIKVIVLAIVLSFGLSYVFAWTAPTQIPPNGNVSAPINTGATTQTKAGDLVVKNLTASSTIINGTLAVTGSIRTGVSSDVCGSTNGGAIRYNATSKSIEFCNETTWGGIAGAAASALLSFTGPSVLVTTATKTGVFPHSWSVVDTNMNVGRVGVPYTLSWSLANAVSCTGSGAWSGSKAVPSGNENITVATAPISNTHNISCVGSGGAVYNGAVVVDVRPDFGSGSPFPYTGILPSPQQGIASDGTNMWVTSNTSISKVTPSGSVTNYPMINAGVGAAFDGINMWTANYAYNSVSKVTPAGVVVATYAIAGNPHDIAFDGTNMWTANFSSNSVTKITPAGATTTYPIASAGPFGIAFDGTNMWTANYSNSNVSKITPAGVVSSYPLGESQPISIAFDGTNMWTVNTGARTFSKITPAGVATSYSFPLDFIPKGITFDGTNMWAIDTEGVIKITPTGAMTRYLGVGPSVAIAFDTTTGTLWTAGGGERKKSYHSGCCN